MKNSNERFGPALKAAMTERSVSYRLVGDAAGVSAGYLHHMMSGRRPVPSVEVLERIAKALSVNPEYFLEYRVRVVADYLLDHPAKTNNLYKAAA